MAVKSSPNLPVVRDPLAVIPVRPEAVETREDSRGMLHLRLNQAPEHTGLGAKVAKWLKYDYSRKLELDEYGTFYYAQIDGKTTLDIIIDRMAKRLNVDRKKAEEAVVLFTKKLMMMNMLALKVPDGTHGKEMR